MSYLKNRIRNEFIFILTNLFVKYHKKISLELEPDLSEYKVRKILKKHNIYFDKSGEPTWFFASFLERRNSVDALTRYFLRYIIDNIPKDSEILVTGCGPGWMLISLGQNGFTKLSGFDYLQYVADAANSLTDLADIEANIWQDDGFNPSTKLKEYDVIIALHWLYTAWGGNYGNEIGKKEDNEKLLKDFISNYLPHLSDNGYLCIELIDAMSNFNVPVYDNFPVRHSIDEVSKCCQELGLTIENKMFCGKHGRLPRMIYFIKKAV